MKQKLSKTKDIKKLQPDWSNEPTYEDLANDLEQSSGFMEDYRKKLLEYDELRDGGKKIEARPGKSTARPKLIRKNNEWKYPALEDPFLNTENMYEVKPATWDDVKSAEQNQLLLNYQWTSKVPKVHIINEAVRFIVDEGRVVIKTLWDMEEKIVTEIQEQPVYASPAESLAMMQEAVMSGQMSPQEFQMKLEAGEPVQTGVKEVEVEVPKLVKNCPKYEVCHNARVTIDPTCEGDITKAQFIIHEYDTNLAELKKDEYDEETGEGIYHNLEHIKDEAGKEIYDEHKSDSYNEFKFTDKARQKLVAYEYWGYWDINGDNVLVPIVATWVGETLIRMEENPFPHKRLPFSMAMYMPKKKDVIGEPDAELLKENQESIGKLTRAAHDITAEQAVGQEFIDETFFTSEAMKQQYYRGNTVFYRGGMDPKRAIYKKSVDAVPVTVFSMIQWQQSDAESLSGTKAFSGGISGNALGDNVGGQRSALDATSKRELSILRRLSEMFKDIARLTIAMNQVYLSEEEVIRITNEEFVKVRRDDLMGEFDLKVDVSTPEKDEDTANKLNMLLQTNAASMDPAEARIIRASIAKLWKQPGIAKQIETFEPQPNPAEEELNRLAIQKAKLEVLEAAKRIEEMDSRIVERVSRTEENLQADAVMKRAKAKEHEAKAELYLEQADQLAVEFVKETSGQNRAEYELDREFDAAVQLQNKSSNKESSKVQ